MQRSLAKVQGQLGKVTRAFAKVRRQLGKVCRALGKVQGQLNKVKRALANVRRALGKVQGQLANVTRQHRIVTAHFANRAAYRVSGLSGCAALTRLPERVASSPRRSGQPAGRNPTHWADTSGHIADRAPEPAPRQ